MCYERFLCILIGVLISSFSDGVFVIIINMDENGSKVGKIYIIMNVENFDEQVIKEIYIYIIKFKFEWLVNFFIRCGFQNYRLIVFVEFFLNNCQLYMK